MFEKKKKKKKKLKKKIKKKKKICLKATGVNVKISFKRLMNGNGEPPLLPPVFGVNANDRLSTVTNKHIKLCHENLAAKRTVGN